MSSMHSAKQLMRAASWPACIVIPYDSLSLQFTRQSAKKKGKKQSHQWGFGKQDVSQLEFEWEAKQNNRPPGDSQAA
jgi:hypothetical protein